MLIRNVFPALFLLGIFPVVVSNVSGQDLPSADPGEVGMSGDGLSRIDTVIQNFIDEKQLAGAVTIVARRGKVVQFRSY